MIAHPSAREVITAPESGRWWTEASKRYAEEGRREGRWGPVAAANIARCLRVWPDRIEAAGLPRPEHVSDVTAEMVAAWAADPWGPGHGSRGPGRLAQATAFQAMWMLRGFLRRYRSRVAEIHSLWRMRRGDATRRRWYDGPTVDRLMELAASDATRLSIALTAWAGLRRREACELRVQDVNLDMQAPTILVHRKGGRRQLLPIARSVANLMRPFVVGKPPEARVYPKSYTAFGSDLVRLGRKAGLPGLSAHDLRRTFGRMLYYERHADLNTIRVLYGHSSPEMTAYYIGASQDELRSTVQLLDRPALEAV